MEFFVARQGKEEKLGPLTIYRVVEMLRDKTISPTDLGWSRDQGEWIALEKIPAFESTVNELKRKDREETLGPEITLDEMRAHSRMREEERKRGKVRVSQEVQPFTRFWARIADYTLVMIALFFYADLPELPEPVSFSELLAMQDRGEDEQFQHLAQMLVIALWAWTALEGLLIWVFGTTPGKAIFGIKVRQKDGTPVPILRSLFRAFYTFILGFGMGLVILSQIGMAFGFFRLLATGQTPWDEHLKLKTHHAPMGLVRILVAIGAFLVLIAALDYFKFS